MGTACTSSSKKKDHKDASEVNVTAKINNQIEIDVVPGDNIPTDLIQRTLKKVDTTDVDDFIQDSASPNIVRHYSLYKER
jgi:hypothetical protein